VTRFSTSLIQRNGTTGLFSHLTPAAGDHVCSLRFCVGRFMSCRIQIMRNVQAIKQNYIRFINQSCRTSHSRSLQSPSCLRDSPFPTASKRNISIWRRAPIDLYHGTVASNPGLQDTNTELSSQLRIQMSCQPHLKTRLIAAISFICGSSGFKEFLMVVYIVQNHNVSGTLSIFRYSEC
jgi:hypothetical protein